MTIPFIRSLCAAALMALSAPMAFAQTACQGQNLIEAMPADQREAMIAAAHAVPYPQGLIYSAEKDGRQVTLIGTYHLHDPRHQALIDKITPRLDEAHALMVEAGPEEEAQLRNALALDPSLAFITTGPTLPEILDESDWQRLRAAAEARGMLAPVAAKMKPWMVTVTLALSPCMMRDMQNGQRGLDHRIIDMATERDLPIRALEPYDTVFSIFRDMPAEDEKAMILTALSTEAHAEDYAVTLADAYFQAEPWLIWEFGLVDAKANSGLTEAEVTRQMTMLEDRMMTSRNRAWLPRIADAAAEGPVVVAVGALHLGGHDGLLDLLARDGWHLTRLDG
ncbi:TraB/GumN family protein [Paracoccus sp. p4-l81]|uniref:TraB/GumN family protein n=1 Tax=Paracoccus sp. p4-l81 TaxID=3342806 RepID=UPI0035BB2DEC